MVLKIERGKRNSPALMNLAWQPYFMWDGAINHLDMQSLFPITHSDEMGETIENVVMKLKEKKAYQEFVCKGIWRFIDYWRAPIESHFVIYGSVGECQFKSTIV